MRTRTIVVDREYPNPEWWAAARADAASPEVMRPILGGERWWVEVDVETAGTVCAWAKSLPNWPAPGRDSEWPISFPWSDDFDPEG